MRGDSRKSKNVLRKTRNDAGSTSETGEGRSASPSPESCGNFVGRASGSKKRWRQPRTVGEFTAQTNAVATMVLNEELSLETAKVFSALARTVAQSLSAELARARAARQEPNLTIGDPPVETPTQ